MWRGWLLLPILLPVLGGIGVLGIHTLRVRRRTVSLLLAVQLLVVAAVFRMEGEPFVFLTLTEGVRFVLRPDALGRLFAELICAVWFAVAFFAFEYMNHEGHRERFFGFYLLTLGALMGVCLAGNLVTLYLFYEMMTLRSVPLVLHIGTRKAFDAAYRYLGFSVTGAGLGLLGLFLLQGFCTTDLFTPGGVLDPARAAQDRGLLLAVFFVMAVGFGCKAGMFPLHAWLPIAHPVAPAPASAVLSGLITKMGVLALIRVAYYLFGWPFLDGSWAQRAVLVLALITIFLGSTLAMREDTLKKRLAYSTVSQVSYVIFGLMLFHPMALEGPVPGGVPRSGEKCPVYGHRRHHLQDPPHSGVPDAGGGQRLRDHHVVLYTGLPVPDRDPAHRGLCEQMAAGRGRAVGGGGLPGLLGRWGADGVRPADGGLSAAHRDRSLFPG